MNLKRQLLLVSLLTLMLPWAGCEIIRETETALRNGQQQFLAGTASALANALTQYRAQFPARPAVAVTNDQVYLHTLVGRPVIDGYFNDWLLPDASLRTLRGTEGLTHFVFGADRQAIYLYVEVEDDTVVYAGAQPAVLDQGSRHADRINLISSTQPGDQTSLVFATEAPGRLLSYQRDARGFEPVPAVEAYWQDIPGGYRLEARIPRALLGSHLGLSVVNTSAAGDPGTRSSSFQGRTPGPRVEQSAIINRVAAELVQPNMRLLVTDAAGWRIAIAGSLSAGSRDASGPGFVRRIYDLIVEPGKEAVFADPDPQGREQQPYISAALQGREMAAWFRSDASGMAIVAVAAPIVVNDTAIGAVVLQQGTDAILSLTNQGLARLINVTLLTTVLVAVVLLGYATWLSRRIRRLSQAAETALESENLQSALPSALADDEIGDLSRSFTYVLQQLGEYNAYLRTLASKLSHELRTPLAIVTSSLENLEHEPLNEASLGYTERAREGADRLRRILAAMSEASRVEELMANAEPERFDLRSVLAATTRAYRDVYAEREFALVSELSRADLTGSPELLIQMLDKLIDNAVDFSAPGDVIMIGLALVDDALEISVTNPGPPLPEHMRTQLFDSMVSMRSGENTRHLGLGLYVARLIAEGHGGRIRADNIDGGVCFTVAIPANDAVPGQARDA